MTARHILQAAGIRAAFEPDCGFLTDLVVTDQGRDCAPLHRAPWIGEVLTDGLPPHQERLQGDFFCAPFGDGGTGAKPLHGWTANGRWQVEAEGPLLRAVLEQAVQGARVVKELRVRDGQPFVYQRHVFTGGAGAVPVANHAMVALPGGGRIAMSAKRQFRTGARAPEGDPARGRSRLAYPAVATDPRAFPMADGGVADLTRFPFGAACEEFLVATEAEGSALGWTAVVRAGGDVFLSLRNPRQLPQTMLWHSHGGRDYAPWSGRHVGCLGVEEGSLAGLDLGQKQDVRHVIGCIGWPGDEAVVSVDLAGGLRVRGGAGTERVVPFDAGHLFGEGLA